MKEKYLISISILLAAIVIAVAWIYSAGVKQPAGSPSPKLTADLEESVLPTEGVNLPVKWGDLGKKMVEAGVVDKDKFESLYNQRGGLTDEEKELLYAGQNNNLKITPQNAGYLLNLFWAFGLANKNPILENGPMMDPRYGGANRFASTGGWNLSRSDAMNYYSRYPWVALTAEQQALVEKISQNIYRPCCDNSTYFPDCNHGMAMLGLLELMAEQGVKEDEMFKYALQVNAYWFPDTYLTIAEYLQSKGIKWNETNPKEILGRNFSSVSGYSRILSEFTPSPKQGDAGCGV